MCPTYGVARLAGRKARFSARTQLHFGQPGPTKATPDKEIISVSRDINVLALVKGSERYVFLYDDESRAETLRTLGRYASNPELSFTWYDAAVLSQKIRQESQKFSYSARFAMPLGAEPDVGSREEG
jgi:hypothetical protein